MTNETTAAWLESILYNVREIDAPTLRALLTVVTRLRTGTRNARVK